MNKLPLPAHYWPFSSGDYEVKAGLHRLGTEFGNGRIDDVEFQIDQGWLRHRREKLAARSECLDKYVVETGCTAAAMGALVCHLIQTLVREHPVHFQRVEELPGFALRCALSGETLHFDRNWRLTGVQGAGVTPAYRSAFDAVACQIQEDLALVEVHGGGDRVTALHLCLPNHWAARDKIGGDFNAVHGPVPGTTKIQRKSRALVPSLASRGPFVRFAWGLATDTRLNHHPDSPPDWPDELWRGRQFGAPGAGMFVRVERQVTVPLAPVSAFLFIIHTYFEDVRALDAALQERLAAAVVSMTLQTRRYKGIDDHALDAIERLRAAQCRGGTRVNAVDGAPDPGDRTAPVAGKRRGTGPPKAPASRRNTR